MTTKYNPYLLQFHVLFHLQRDSAAHRAAGVAFMCARVSVDALRTHVHLHKITHTSVIDMVRMQTHQLEGYEEGHALVMGSKNTAGH